MEKKAISASMVAVALAVGLVSIPAQAETSLSESISSQSDSFTLTEKQKNALKLAQEIEELLIDNGLLNKRQIKSVYDPNTVKLRSGNFIEGILDSDEGLSLEEIGRIYSIGQDATKTAERYYKSDSMLRDAYRHFIWNYNGANDKKLGKPKTRIATVNHEWGLILIDDALNYYNDKVRENIRLGMDSTVAMSTAFAETISELPKMKKNKIKNFSQFQKVATKGNVMDWNNNYYGLHYSYMKNVDEAFEQAKPFLILAEAKVTTSDYRKVYEGGFWK